MSDDQDRLRDALHDAVDAVDPPMIEWTPRVAVLRARRQRTRRAAMAGVLTACALVAGVAVARNGVGGRGARSGPIGSEASDPTSVAPTPALTEGTAMQSYGATVATAEPTWYTLARPPISIREGMAAAWTGSEYIVWGGRTDAPDGGAYDPATDQWRTIADSPLAGRADAVAAWTGSKLIVWGGVAAGGEDGTAPLDDGALYDPVADEWYPMASLPGGGRRASNSAAAWDGEELLVWGGGAEPNDGAAYNPATNEWRPLPPAPIAWRDAPAGAWTGSELIVWGGSRTVDGSFTNLADGAVYHPLTDTWEVLPEAPMQAAVVDAAWTGTQVVFTPGYSGDPTGIPFAPDIGGLYDPATGSWTAAGWLGQHPGTQLVAVDGQVLSTAKGHSVLLDPTSGSATDMLGDELDDGVDPATTVWTGSQVLALTTDGHGLIGATIGGPPTPVACVATTTTEPAAAGGGTAPAAGTDSEPPVPAEPTAAPIVESTAIDEAVSAETPPPSVPAWSVTAGELAPSSAGWSVTMVPLEPRTEAATAWTGREYVVWGGTDGATVFADGVVVDPATGDVRTMSPAPIDARVGALAVWTGSEVLIVGGASEPSVSEPLTSQPAAAYDPATDRWRLIPRSEIQIDLMSGESEPAIAWTGADLYAFQGTVGAMFDAASGNWLTLPSFPTGDDVIAVAWSGRELLAVTSEAGQPAVLYVYGSPQSRPPNDDVLASAGGEWREVSTSPAPIDGGTATWTDNELLVAGGSDPAGTTWTSAAVDPATGEWRELAATPYHPGSELIWTGAEALFVMKGGYGLIDPATGDVTEQESPVWLEAGTGHGTGDGAVFLGDLSANDCTVGLAVARYQP